MSISIYNAIMKAADSIEKNPDLYNFMAIRVGTCNSPQCMLGWIGFHLGMTGKLVYQDVMPALGLSPNGGIAELGWTFGKGSVHDPKHCAAFLRQVAVKYRAPQKLTGIPATVRAIFAENAGAT
jgi:hypothetical protein